jgi:hypothetical protein
MALKRINSTGVQIMPRSSAIAYRLSIAVPALAAIAIGVAISKSSADTGVPDRPCAGLSPETRRPTAPDASSQSTREVLDSCSHLVATIELQDGQVHPTFGPFARDVYIFKTIGGRFVVRVADLPLRHGWYGPF